MVPEIDVLNRSSHPLPSYQSAGAAGADVRAFLEQPLVLQPMQRAVVPTGLFMAVPEGYEVQVRPRSGLALRHGITLINAPGTIDSDYRGELQIALVNLSDTAFTVEDGMRIAQLVVAACVQVHWRPVPQLNGSARDQGAFGHTGYR
jgi:dUTP pyrophosphatase